MLLTGRVDVEVSGLVSHIPCGLQTRSSGVHLAGVAHVLCHIHRVWTLVNVLTGKQHLDLGEVMKVEPKCLAISPYLRKVEHFFVTEKKTTHLVNALDFGKVGDAVRSFSVFVGFDLCLKGDVITKMVR